MLLIHHRRPPSEHDVLIQQVRERVLTHNRKEEVANMGQTIAETLIQEGRELGYTEATIQSKQEYLVALLRVKFGQLPQSLVERIEAIRTIDQLDTIFHQSIMAVSLEEIEIE